MSIVRLHPELSSIFNEGASSVIDSRREDAYRQMYEACNGKYRIDSEGPNAEGGAAMPMGSGYMYYQSQ